MIELIGAIAGTMMPFFNISLILRIRQRKSSQDISLVWTMGVFVCTVLMFPAGVISESLTLKCFSIVNLVLFSLVVYHVVRYRGGQTTS